MAARKKSTKKTSGTAAPKKKTTSVPRATRKRTSAAKARSSEKRGKVAVKPKGKPASSKETRKRKEQAAVAQSATRRRPKSGKRTSIKAKASAKANKTISRTKARVSAESKSNTKRVEVKLPSKKDHKPESKVAAHRAAEPGSTMKVATAEAPAATPSAATRVVSSAKATPSGGKEQKTTSREEPSAALKPTKPAVQRQGFKLNEFVVYPAHGVGQIVAIEEQEVAGFTLELFVISFSKDKMTLRVPTSKVAGVGMRKISDPDTAKRSLEILTGRARVKRTMWSRRAQEYETKINSGDINAIAEVVRDLYRSEAQPEQSYSERQLYEAALDRMVREIAAVQKSNEIDALRAVEAQLQKSHGRSGKSSTSPSDAVDPEIEEAA